MMRAGIPLVLLALAGCSAPGTPQTGGAGADGCGASEYADLLQQDVGQLDIRQPQGNVRVVQAGGVMTTDFRADRLNFEVDAGGTITHIFCG